MSLVCIWMLLAPLLGAQPLVLQNANVIDGVSAQPDLGTSIVVAGGKIQAGAAPAGARALDLKGRWVLPGYVDAHVHLADLAAARTALRSGVTTARSMGVSRFTDVALRDLHAAGAGDIPDVVAAGYHVRPRVAEEFLLDFPKLMDLAPRLSGTESVRRAVRAMIDRGATVIKILATERAGLPETDPRQRTLTDEEMAAAVDEAASRRIPVAAHAHGDEGAMAAVRAGVRSIEHGTYLSDRTLAEMKKRGTYLTPTIAVVTDLLDPGGDYTHPALAIRARGMLPRLRETVRRAHQMGIPIVAGTDTGYGPNSVLRIPDEIRELRAVGLSPMEAIQAATARSAELLGIAGRTGAVKVGLEADLIVVERNPLDDLTVLYDVLMVINDGKIAVDRIVR